MAAREEYGVVLAPSAGGRVEVEVEATRRCRQQLAATVLGEGLGSSSCAGDMEVDG